MLDRLLKPSKKQSFFLFGARGVGKSTFIKKQFIDSEAISLDLLNPDLEDKYSRFPREFEKDVLAAHLKLPDSLVFVDEVQKVPALLNLVHKLIESHGIRFILTGSSARKLKRGQANLLAGRAFSYELFPFTQKELLQKNTNITELLSFGSIPKVFEFNDVPDKIEFLNSYVKTYLREEIRLEQLVRKINPFKDFLEIAAQCSGKILNFSRISRQVGVSVHTVKSYFQILEDTLIGYLVPAFHESIRKSQIKAPKFYIFDLGVKRSLEGSLEEKVREQTSQYGELFEHWVMQEVIRRNSYSRKHFKVSYFATKNNVEIDLILSKGAKHLAVEIKNTDKIDDMEVAQLERVAGASNFQKTYYISRDTREMVVHNVHCLPYDLFLEEIFGASALK